MRNPLRPAAEFISASVKNPARVIRRIRQHARPQLLLGCLCATLAFSAPSANAGVTYTEVAHSDDALYAGLKATIPAFNQFRFSAPGLNNLGQVSFLAGALDGGGGDTGIFVGNGSAPASAFAVIDGNNDDPTNPFSFITGFSPSLSNAGEVVFGAGLKNSTDPVGIAGVFKASNALPVTAIATTSGVLAGGAFSAGPYTSISARPSISPNGAVIFSGVYNAGATAGLFNGPDPLANRLIDTTQTARHVSFWNEPVITGNGIIGAVTNNFDPAGPTFYKEIAALPVGGLPNETALASTVTPPPVVIADSTLDINNAQTAVFKGLLTGAGAAGPAQQILVATPGTSGVSVADAKFFSTDFPFKNLVSEAAVNNPGTVGFVAQSIFNDTQLLAHQIGRKTSQGNVYAEVVRTGQIINGRVVDELAFERGGLNDNGEFTFVADFTDGSSGVYKASFGPTAPGVIPQPGIKTNAEVRRREIRTNQTTTNSDTDSAPVPGHAISAAAFGAGPPMAIADGKNDATGSHLKGASFARSEFSPPVVANLTSAQSSTSLITNWVVPNPAPGAGGPTTETILMFVSIDGTLLNEFTESIGPLILPALGSVSLPGAQIAAIAGPRNFPALPLSAEVSYTVNANVNGASSNVFGAYASLRNGDLFLAGDWATADWDVLNTFDQLKADTNFLGVFSYTVNYDQTFALEFVLETFAASNFFGQGSASSDFSNTANFRLTTASGAPLLQLGADGTAVVPLPPAIAYMAFGLMVLIRTRSNRTV